MKRVGFIVKPKMTEAGQLLDELVPWLDRRGDQAVVVDEDQVGPAGATLVPETELGQAVDIAVVLGGDGTMLRASHLVADYEVPVLGINLGRLGFLTSFEPARAKEAIDAALAGELAIEPRMRLSVRYLPTSGKPIVRTSLNDAVIHQGAMARLIELEARLDGDLITTYRADGLIVATPTGSTAYNLAAGGPILFPGHKAMALTPICAHALTNRPLVVQNNGTIEVSLVGDSRGVALTVDGQWARSFLPADRVQISEAAIPLLLYQAETPYFDILREKLHWGLR